MKNKNITLAVFTAMNFVLAMISLVFNGILDKVALSLDISVGSAGLLNTMYSLGAAFGVPIALIVFRKIERTRMLKLMLLATILVSLGLIFGRSFQQLLLARLFMGVSANCYSVLAIATIISLFPGERQGRSMAILIMGNSLGLVVGVPLTRVLSSLFDWRGIFWFLCAVMTLTLVYFQLFLPPSDAELTKMNLRNELVFLKQGKIYLLILYALLMFIGYGAYYTYMTPYLLLLFPPVESFMALVLFFLGVASFTGNLIGGTASDLIGYKKSLFLGAVLQTAAALLILLSQPFMIASIIFSLFWIMSAWFTGLQLNLGIAKATHNKSSFMISLNSSAIQLGSAIGSSLSAVIISQNRIQQVPTLSLITGVGIILLQFVYIRRYKAD